MTDNPYCTPELYRPPGGIGWDRSRMDFRPLLPDGQFVPLDLGRRLPPPRVEGSGTATYCVDCAARPPEATCVTCPRTAKARAARSAAYHMPPVTPHPLAWWRRAIRKLKGKT